MKKNYGLNEYKQSNMIGPDHNHYIMVPGEVLQEILSGIRQLLESSKVNHSEGLEGYVSEKEAQDLLGRKATWFWSMRTKGLLSFAKVGNKVFYKVEDLEAFLDSHRKEAFNKKRR